MNQNILKQPSVIKRIIERYKNGYSPVILICGKMRVGKTTKGYLISNWLSWILFKHEWNWKENTLLTMDSFINKLNNPNPEILLLDETQRILGKKDWYKEESRLFDKIVTSQAYKHYIIILIIPRASALGSDHAVNVDYVLRIKNRVEVWPYKIETNEWDIALRQKKINKFYMARFRLDIKNKKVMKAFKEELEHLKEFTDYIEENLKVPIMNEVRYKRGEYNPNLPLIDKNLVNWAKKFL